MFVLVNVSLCSLCRSVNSLILTIQYTIHKDERGSNGKREAVYWQEEMMRRERESELLSGRGEIPSIDLNMNNNKLRLFSHNNLLWNGIKCSRNFCLN